MLEGNDIPPVAEQSFPQKITSFNIKENFYTYSFISLLPKRLFNWHNFTEWEAQCGTMRTFQNNFLLGAWTVYCVYTEAMGREVMYNAWEQLLPQCQQSKIKQPTENTRFVNLLIRRMAWGCRKFFLGSNELAIAAELVSTLLLEKGPGTVPGPKAKWYMLVYIHISQGQPSPWQMCLAES